jgi:copper chaperone NosL
LLAVAGSDEQHSLQPPVIYFGQHECDVCRMIISDKRYAAAALVEDERGQSQSRIFDDIGCLFQFEQDDPNLKIAARFVRDAQTSQWLDAARATYLHSLTLKTPMAFHVAACASPDQARTMQTDYPGGVLDLAGVREKFVAGTLREF